MAERASATRPDPTPTVVLYRSPLLARTETFILQQARALTRWRPLLAGERMVADGLPLDGVETLLLAGGANRLGAAFQRLCRLLWLPHPASVHRLRRTGARLVHAQFGIDAVDLWPQVRALGLPMLVSLYGYDIAIHRDWWEAGHGGLGRRRYPRRLLRLARNPRVHFIAVSAALRERAIEYGIPADKVSVNYIGVDLDAFRPGPVPLAQRARRVLFVGRLVEKKGAEYLIRAFARVRDAVPDAQLVIVGDGPLRPSLEALARSLGVIAEFVGSISSDASREQMHHARVLCVPSVTAANGDTEGLPMVVLEALACGLPVATSAKGAVGEAVLHMQTGIEFPERSDAIAAHLVRLLQDDALAEALSLAGRARMVERFSLVKCIEATQDLYDRVASSTSIHQPHRATPDAS